MILYIHHNFTVEFDKYYSYDEVKDIIEQKNCLTPIKTHCLSFFQLDYLDDFTDICVIKEDNGLKYISLKELLSNEDYTDKEIRKTHNTYKMLVAGAFEWREL